MRTQLSTKCFVQVLEDHSRPVLSLAIADNKLFSGSYDYTIKVWSLDTLQRLKTLTGRTSWKMPKQESCIVEAKQGAVGLGRKGMLRSGVWLARVSLDTQVA